MNQENYDDLRPYVESAEAIKRLLGTDDFQTYQAEMRKELDLIIRKTAAATLDALPGCQGALIQQLRILSLPEKVVKLAETMVKHRRMEQEAQGA